MTYIWIHLSAVTNQFYTTHGLFTMFILIMVRLLWYPSGLQSFKEFPPRQKPASFNLDEVQCEN